ncbi:MAG: hypothetical protein ACJ75F_13730 [Flavisolibacter sp.]
MKTLLFAMIVVCCFAGSGCYYDSEEELYGTGCDTTNVTYSVTINTIINNYGCLTCHSGPTSISGFSLQGYTNLKAKVDDQRLLGAINHENGFAAMPQGMPKMNQCDINKVKAWVDAGAPNN